MCTLTQYHGFVDNGPWKGTVPLQTGGVVHVCFREVFLRQRSGRSPTPSSWGQLSLAYNIGLTAKKYDATSTSRNVPSVSMFMVALKNEQNHFSG